MNSCVPILALLLVTSVAQGQNIVRGEYWIDEDPGFGLALPLDPPLVPASDILPTQVLVSLAGYAPGSHVVAFRTQDDAQRWSLSNFKNVYIADSSHGEIVRIEYFWDSDPGFGLSVLDTVLANPGADWADTFVVEVPWGTAPFSDHLLFMRSQDDHGRWSLTNLVDTVSISGSVDVGELEDRTGITVFPNPFAEGITVSPTAAGQVRVVIYDPKGQLVYDRFVNSTTTIELARYASGPYQAYFWKDRKVIHTVTLLKQ